MRTPDQTTVEDAIALVQEKSRRKTQCDCLDCRAQKILVAEIERLREELAGYRHDESMKKSRE